MMRPPSEGSRGSTRVLPTPVPPATLRDALDLTSGMFRARNLQSDPDVGHLHLVRTPRMKPEITNDSSGPQLPKSESPVIQWRLDADPAHRWQVMRDLAKAPGERIVAERSRRALDSLGARGIALQGPVFPEFP